ncbi:hypothetical protein NQ317_007544 [Molorchus minor]|uniref:Lipase n=1 Tax=Molorchus minor TaxID=1323400 RepID=A0ABQ9K783_9CUCU|nr:hypothetical protein NQ317_007544 [Molorchus minor]
MKVLFMLVFTGIAHCLGVPTNNEYDFNDNDLKSLGVANLRSAIAEASKVKCFHFILLQVDMIRHEGYPVENHYVVTPDDYILNMHRIPKGRNGESNGKVVYLQHGILASSSDWIIAGSGMSLGFILADEGYDVWMGNVRGNTYSRNHTTLDPDRDSNFWHFSWHEIGTIDLPTMIDYALERSGADGVYYCGHSQGTTVFYVMATTRPEYNNKIKAHVSLAPIGFMNHMTSPLMKLVAMWDKPLSALVSLIGIDEFLPSQGFISMVGEVLCSNGISKILCKNALFAVCGFSNDQMNMTLLPRIMAHAPAGASTRQLLHYAQEVNSGKFRFYDLGLMSNKRTYGSFFPPVYDLSKVTVPVYLIHSRNDWLAGEKDVERLCKGLANCVGKFLVSDFSFNHLDFTYGVGAPSLVYNKVVSLFSRH